VQSQTSLFGPGHPSLRTIEQYVARRSWSEFVAKLGVALEEADETQLWLELVTTAKLLPMKRVQSLLDEASELVAVLVASRKSASANLKSEI